MATFSRHATIEWTGDVTRGSGAVTAGSDAFSVLWPSHVRSITSWVGQVVEVNGAPELRTLWHLVADIPDADESTGLWATVHSGADTFR